jgi:hypothetical protein
MGFFYSFNEIVPRAKVLRQCLQQQFESNSTVRNSHGSYTSRFEGHHGIRGGLHRRDRHGCFLTCKQERARKPGNANNTNTSASNYRISVRSHMNGHLPHAPVRGRAVLEA